MIIILAAKRGGMLPAFLIIISKPALIVTRFFALLRQYPRFAQQKAAEPKGSAAGMPFTIGETDQTALIAKRMMRIASVTSITPLPS